LQTPTARAWWSSERSIACWSESTTRSNTSTSTPP